MRDTIEMAREVGIPTGSITGYDKELKAFEALVRADEREACAKTVLAIANDDAGNPYKQALRMGAEAIRVRGNT